MYQHNCFLTLTYDEKKETYHNVFNYPDIQKFKKLLRNFVNTTEYSHLGSRKLKQRRVDKRFYRKIEIFNVHEYGKNGKKHWHLVVFGFDFTDKTVHTIKNSIPLYTSKQLEKLWRHGFNTIGNVTEASAMYQAQYMEKDFKNRNENSNKKSNSKHSGIAKPYFLKYWKQILTLGYIPFQGRKLPIPRYFTKIAKRHWAHFYDRSLFVDDHVRKAPFRPFKGTGHDIPRLEIADLWALFDRSQKLRILDLEAIWQETLSVYLTTAEEPDFIKSASNKLYDLRNKQQPERF